MSPPPESESRRTPMSALAEIRALATQPGRYKELEQVLWANVDVLVPAVLSMSDWTKSLGNLRDANLEAERATGTVTEDPLKEIRDFLSSVKDTANVRVQ